MTLTLCRLCGLSWLILASEGPRPRVCLGAAQRALTSEGSPLSARDRGERREPRAEAGAPSPPRTALTREGGEGAEAASMTKALLYASSARAPAPHTLAAAAGSPTAPAPSPARATASRGQRRRRPVNLSEDVLGAAARGGGSDLHIRPLLQLGHEAPRRPSELELEVSETNGSWACWGGFSLLSGVSRQT